MKIYTTLLILVFNLLSLSGQSFLTIDTARYIEWQNDDQLKWTDYQLRNLDKEKKSFLALTEVFHSVRGHIEEGDPNFEVRVLFVKKGSWTTTYGSKRLLAHEQLHFDLAELYGRKLRSTIASLGRQEVSDLKAYKLRIRRLLDEFKRKSMTYDNETVHGQLADKQRDWRHFVDYELNRLSQYSNN